jgi:hypothetical protein
MTRLCFRPCGPWGQVDIKEEVPPVIGTPHPSLLSWLCPFTCMGSDPLGLPAHSLLTLGPQHCQALPSHLPCLGKGGRMRVTWQLLRWGQDWAGDFSKTEMWAVSSVFMGTKCPFGALLLST